MLTIYGDPLRKTNRLCDGFSRRSFLKIGGMALGGLSLPQLLKAEDQGGRGKKNHKAIINIFLPGGPSHLDFWDLKPDAPKEIRGDFRPIKTNVEGIEICELFPRIAKMMDKFAPIRSIVGSEGRHDGYQCMTGWTHRDRAPTGGWPNFGAYVSKLEGQATRGIPPNISLMYGTGHRDWGASHDGGWVGPAHAPVSLVGKKGTGPSSDMTLQ
ncbi:MAG: DUF1501 domain-containing protein, partial [Planctomycetota bacterium]